MHEPRIHARLIAVATLGLVTGAAAGVAAQDADRARPVEVTGSVVEGSEACRSGTVKFSPGFHHEFGYTCTEPGFEMSDPRLEGTLTTKWSIDFYGGEFEGLNIGSTAASIENDEGVWRQRPQEAAGLPWDIDSGDLDVTVFHGEGGYDGLIAMLEIAGGTGGIRGYIVEGEFPPPPDNASTK